MRTLPSTRGGMRTKARNPHANSQRKAANSSASNLSEPAMLRRAEELGELGDAEAIAPGFGRVIDLRPLARVRPASP
jgi:hypothetical protein